MRRGSSASGTSTPTRSASAQELLAPIAEHHGPCFIESEAYVAGCQLDALGEALQEEDGRRAAEKVGIIDYFEPPFEDDGSF